ncbi:MAG: hypothetical protein VYE00_16100 [Candidatus Poribacteria bacterium]|nr:hypothetical protein [Candidatus Poribacteria bacterium]
MTDVEPGDGGLIVIPGSYKGEFARPDDLLSSDEEGLDAVQDPVFTNLIPKSGDFLVISELLTQSVLRWRHKDKDRRFLVLRYVPQYEGKMSLPEAILELLVPETQELVSSVGYGHQKEITQQDVVTLSALGG